MLGPIIGTSFRVGFDTLRANPLRTSLSTLGIVMGVGALVSVLSLGDGMEQFARDQIVKTTDVHGVNVAPVTFRTVDGQRFARTDIVDFTTADVDTVRALVPASAMVTLVAMGTSLANTSADTTPIAVQVVGTNASVVSDLPTPVAHGRFFTDADVASSAPVAVISDTLARRLAKSEPVASLLGDTVLFQGTPRAIVGILGVAKDGEAGLPRAIMPVGAARQVVSARPTMMVKATRVEDVTVIRASLESLFTRRYGAAWKERVTVVTNAARVEQVQQAMLVFKLFMGTLTGISLLVGGIGIMNVLLASVIERTREIGIRKATGAQQRHILMQFLAESIAITSFGSVIGVALGVGTAFGATAIMRQMTSAEIHAGLSLSTLAVAVIASVTIGVTFGLYPALRAARLSPIVAIHHE
jgi:putative ABC transport system permease protein